jgi:hypothetical protein
MNLQTLALTSLITLAATAAAQEPANPVDSTQTSIQAPTLVAGQQWTYRRINLWNNEETERFSQTLNLQSSGQWNVFWTIHSSKDEARIGTTEEKMENSTHGFADARMSGRYAPLQFPLSLGKSWTSNYTFQSNPNTLVDVSQTARVSGWETVTVPAGTFKALKVVHTGWYNATENSSRWTGRISETFWYAPAARRIVAQEYRDTTGSGSTWDQRRDELVAQTP